MLNSTRDRISSSFVIAINFNSWHIAFLVAYCICFMVEFHTTVKISDVGGLFRPRKFSTIIVSTLRLKPSTGLTSPVSGVDYHLVEALILTVLIRHNKDCDFDIALTQPFKKNTTIDRRNSTSEKTVNFSHFNNRIFRSYCIYLSTQFLVYV